MSVLWTYLGCAVVMLLLSMGKFAKMWTNGKFGMTVDGNAEGEAPRRFQTVMALSVFTSLAGGALLWPFQLGVLYLARKAANDRPMAGFTFDVQEIQQFSSNEEFAEQVRSVTDQLEQPLKQALRKSTAHPAAISYTLHLLSWSFARWAHLERGFPESRARQAFLEAADRIATERVAKVEE